MDNEHQETTVPAPNYCIVSPENCINSRRCFMTGEHCSKQLNIQQERKKLHSKQELKKADPQQDQQTDQTQEAAQAQQDAAQKKKGATEYKNVYEINAFVVMNFSDMSNVVYKWRLKSYIESLKKYLFIDPETARILCVAHPCKTKELPQDVPAGDWKHIDKINVIRSDSNPASNYVICNRVCQQMQIADLIIVDVSVENTNVFYEFGMAMALGKLILPICYNESIFEHVIPRVKLPDGTLSENFARLSGKMMPNAYHVKVTNEGQDNTAKEDTDEVKSAEKTQLEKHIDCFPWRRQLFENYGLRFKAKDSWAQYAPNNLAMDPKYHFTDLQYNRFPYDQKITHLNDDAFSSLGTDKYSYDLTKNDPSDNVSPPDNEKIGNHIYTILRNSYNNANTSKNTLVVYTMDGFMNGDEAGRCMINFYTFMTAQMKKMQCFRGDRVGILVQENRIKENQKDAKAKKDLLYNIGNIIHIGMNQATYVAQKERIKTRDFLPINDAEAGPTDDEKILIQRVKEHVGNRSITILPEKPVYVDHVKDGIQKDVFRKQEDLVETYAADLYQHYYCLYHIMLRTLRYTNEVVVDISNNSIQALFWLGAAHGSDIHAITVRYDRSDQEKAEVEKEGGKPERKIFDVSGLWTAVLRSHDTDGFYKELMQAQLSIEQHTKLVLDELDIFSEQTMDYLYEATYRTHAANSLDDIVGDKMNKEFRKLESYYRDYFWRRMLRYNHLHIYLPQFDEMAPNHSTDPRTYLVKWDVDTMAELSRYLSKRKVIGEYYIETLGEDTTEAKKQTNFVAIGRNAEPIFHGSTHCSLPHYVRSQENLDNVPHILHDPKESMHTCHQNDSVAYYCREFRGEPSKGNHTNYFTYVPALDCFKCINRQGTRQAGHPEWENIHQRTDDTIHTPEHCPFQKAPRNPGKSDETQERDTFDHLQLAQMLLWREKPATEDDIVKFQVSLTGASGPATRALAAILVDREQKIEMLGEEWDKNRNQNKLFLNELQQKIRETFMGQYIQELQELAKGDETKTKIVQLVKLYLSTVLYRYFLPFLTWEDEHRISNGTQAFLSAMRPSESTAEQNAFEKIVIDRLDSLLRDFKGAEAMYAVTVEVPAGEYDRRKIKDIQLASDMNKRPGQSDTENDIDGVTCFFIKRDSNTATPDAE